MALVALVTAPLSVLAAARLARRAQPSFREQWTSTGELNGRIEEICTGHPLVKAFGREEEARKAFTEANHRLTAATRKAQSASSALQPVMGFLSNLNYVLIAVVGGVRVAAGALSVGDIQAFVQYSRQYSQPFIYLAGMAGTVQSGLASGERVLDLLDLSEEEPDTGRGEAPGPAPAGRVTFEGRLLPVRRGRAPDRGPDADRRARSDRRDRRPHGRRQDHPRQPAHALLRRPLRAHHPGRRGHRRDTPCPPARRDRHGPAGHLAVPGVIAENIAYGADAPSREEIVEAAVLAHADRFIRTLPHGYDTIVDEEATVLSAGEKQLLTIARAFLARPSLLVLDEATSSVDTRTEVLVQQALARLREGRTAFVIAHRLSTIRHADTIVVMDGGSIVETGTHEQLLAAGGAYARLQAAGAGYYVECPTARWNLAAQQVGQRGQRSPC